MATSNPRWPLYETVCYLTGRGITFGDPWLAPPAVQPSKYSINWDYWPSGGAAAVDNNFKIIADRSLDHVLVGKKLEGTDSPATLVKELAGKLKVGGHLVLILAKQPTNPDRDHRFDELGVAAMVGQAGRWRQKVQVIDDQWQVWAFKKVEGKTGILLEQAQPAKRACLCRYGALGDMIILSPVLAALKAEGYHVTLNATPYCLPAAEHNPHIDNVLIQEREAIPNLELGEYWKYWQGKYDRYINLSESLEGGLLKVEGRKDFYTTQAWRHKTCNVNYFDRTMALAGYPDQIGTRGQLFFSDAEERRAKDYFGPLDRNFVAIWALNGSSHHKAYPLMESVLRDWLASHNDARVITVGDQTAQLLEFAHPQVIPQAGRWQIRQSLIATKYADLVVGPESVIINAAGCFDTPKIPLLSHSSHENLCKYWENDYCLTPSAAEAPCHPCHQLHYTKESCPLKKMLDADSGEELATGPACIMNAIDGQRMMDRLDEVYSKWRS